MPQCENVGILFGIGIAEDGVGEEFCRIRMQEVAAFFACHHEVGIGIGLLCGDDFGETQQRQVCRDDSDKVFFGVVEGFAV